MTCHLRLVLLLLCFFPNPGFPGLFGDCNGLFKDRKPSPVEHRAVMKAHSEWLAARPNGLSWFEYFEKAESDVRRANYCRADLSNAILAGADLSGANLTEARLVDANLSDANLTGATLAAADLTRAKLVAATLNGANLRWASLTPWTDLSRARLRGAALDNADLQRATLTETELYGATLRRANLLGADLSKAKLSRFGELVPADLSGAYLAGAKLIETDLTEVNLTNARLMGANLTGAYLAGADLTGARFFVHAGELPDIPSLAKARALDQVYTDRSALPGLAELREAFRKAAFPHAAQIMTYLVRRTQEAEQTFLERWFNRLLFNWTCGYGLYPGRCLWILFGLAFLLSFVYWFALTSASGGGLWALWASERLKKDEGQAEPVRLSFAQPFPLSLPPRAYYDMESGAWKTTAVPPGDLPRGRLHRIGWLLLRFLKAWSLALYFSLLSAFHFGWRDLNVGNWIARIQPREYTLRPTGWVRVVSGLQSLISVYLVALWVLSYFGRPFE